MAHAKPSLSRLETRAVEEDSRSKSARQLWRKEYEEFCQWIREQGRELDYLDLDNQLSEYLRVKYFEGKPRSFAVSVVKAVKFEVPAELGRDQLWRARSACAGWDSTYGPWTESDPQKVRAIVLLALRTPSLLHFLGSSLGVFHLVAMRRLFAAMPSAVDNAVCRAFEKVGVTTPQLLLEDFRHFFTRQMFGDGEIDGEPRRHTAIRLIIEHSPALLQLEMSGSAAFQVDGHFALFGQEICAINCDTVGLRFSRWNERADKGLALQDGNNLEKTVAPGASAAQVTALGEAFRRFVDPHDVSDVLQVVNPKTLATISQLFPDAKYDVAFLQETFDPFDETAAYNLEETNWLDRIRGSARECYLSRLKDEGRFVGEFVTHLLKTQEHLDSQRVKFYKQQLQETLQAGGRQRPTALVLDFFVDGQIHAVQPDEDDSLRGPGGRRKQKHRVEVCNEKFPERSSKRGAWFLLDGHHKVEAAAQLGCSLNFLIISPCAEPYTPLEATDEFGSPLTRRATFPLLWPAGVEEDLCIRWSKGNLCRHSPLLLSSAKKPPEAWQDYLACTCFCQEDWFPTWGFSVMRLRNHRSGRRQFVEEMWSRFGKEHELFSTHLRSAIDELPVELQNDLYGF